MQILFCVRQRKKEINYQYMGYEHVQSYYVYEKKSLVVKSKNKLPGAQTTAREQAEVI